MSDDVRAPRAYFEHVLVVLEAYRAEDVTYRDDDLDLAIEQTKAALAVSQGGEDKETVQRCPACGSRTVTENELLNELALRKMYDALAEIARGRSDNGRPLGGEDARQLTRTALTDLRIGWSDNDNFSAWLQSASHPPPAGDAVRVASQCLDAAQRLGHPPSFTHPKTGQITEDVARRYADIQNAILHLRSAAAALSLPQQRKDRDVSERDEAFEAMCAAFADAEAADGRTIPWRKASEDLKRDYRRYMRSAFDTYLSHSGERDTVLRECAQIARERGNAAGQEYAGRACSDIEREILSRIGNPLPSPERDAVLVREYQDALNDLASRAHAHAARLADRLGAKP